MIRRAKTGDIEVVVAIYGKILDRMERGELSACWKRGVYPTMRTATEALKRGELFVYDLNGTVVASAIINQQQLDVYKKGHWRQQTADDKVMVLHTLTVEPETAHQGIGREFVSFYEHYAIENQCVELRMDTNEKNVIARAFYKKIGYTEVGIVPTNFNGIAGVNLVLLEKVL